MAQANTVVDGCLMFLHDTVRRSGSPSPIEHKHQKNTTVLHSSFQKEVIDILIVFQDGYRRSIRQQPIDTNKFSVPSC